uniref:FidL-like protein n=1 Tax=Serratia proteamaculans TaxID=28151 RepID=UPI001F4C25FD|nr:FidL-like protein [Serratia proteamaculans]ULG16496.1 hypothetical protein 1137p_00099 [Serratia proteamaculans]
MKIKTTIIMASILLISASFFVLFTNAKVKSIVCEADITVEKNIENEGVVTIHSTPIIFLKDNNDGQIRLKGFLIDKNKNKFTINRIQEFTLKDTSNNGYYYMNITKETKKENDNVDDKLLSNFHSVINDGGEVRQLTKIGKKTLLINNLLKPEFVCSIMN